MCAWPTKASASARRRRRNAISTSPRIIAACEITGAEAIHPGYGFLSENARFAEIVNEHGITFIGPDARTYPHDGRQDRRQADGEGASAFRPCRARTARCIGRGSARSWRERDRLSGADQGDRRRRRPRHEGGARARPICRSRFRPRAPKPRPPSATTRSIWRNISRSRAISKSRCWPTPRQCLHLGERDCSLQRRHQKVWEEAPLARRSTPQQRDEIGGIVTRALEKLGYLGAGTDRIPVRGRRLLFHRDEHAAAGGASGHRSDHRHRHRARADPHRRRRRASRWSRRMSCSRGHAIECRINAENAFTFQPSPGTITHFHAPGGLGVRFDQRDL